MTDILILVVRFGRLLGSLQIFFEEGASVLICWRTGLEPGTSSILNVSQDILPT